MYVALIRTPEGEEPRDRGVFLTEADARTWVQDMAQVDPLGLIPTEFTFEPRQIDYPHVVISLEIENTYELGGDVTTYAKNIVIPVLPSDDDEYEEWFRVNITDWSGSGNSEGDSWYDFTVTASSDENVIAVGEKYDWGY